MSKNRTYLTKEQKSWIARNFSKLATGSNSEEARKICDKIARKALEGKSSTSFTKVERGTLVSALGVALKALDSAINKYNQSPEQFADYIKAAKDKKKILESLEKKLK